MALLKGRKRKKGNRRNKSSGSYNEQNANSSYANTSHSRQEGQLIACAIIINVSISAAFMSYRIYCDVYFVSCKYCSYHLSHNYEC